jgi:hypothetical protein
MAIPANQPVRRANRLSALLSCDQTEVTIRAVHRRGKRASADYVGAVAAATRR